MDRIQKALDKAKEAQNNQVFDTPKETLKNSVPNVQVEKGSSKGFDNIAYTETKVVDVSLKELVANGVIAGQYDNQQSAVFRMLRTQVLQKMRDNDWNTLAITSPTEGEGKSLVSSNLAMAMAMELNQTVLLVDMDLRNPSISKYFNLNAKIGLKDYLEGSLKLSDVLINPSVKRLVILPGVGRAENSAELLSSPKMLRLISDLKSQYDSRMIIFDMPPVLQSDDVLLASKYIDGVLLVLEDGKNKEAEIVKTMQLIEGDSLLGTVLNKVEKPPIHQSY